MPADRASRSAPSAALPGSGSAWRAKWGIALLPLAAHVGLLVTFDLASHLASTLFWLAVGSVGMVLAVRHLARSPAAGSAPLLLVAVALRLLMLPLQPTLSDDVHRYLWDGRVAGAGFNPYALAPDDPALAGLRDPSWKRLPHRDVATVYPPLAMAVFSIASRLPHPVLVLKGLLTAADVAACWLLMALARALGVPRHRVLWYAWNPLVTLEVAGMGHVDGLGVAAMLLATWLVVARPGRPLAAGLAAAGGVLTKLWPLVALPVWTRLSARRGWFLAGAGGLTACLLAPVGVLTGGVPPGLVRYGLSWEFDGPLYEPLWRLLAWLDAPRLMAAALDRLKDHTGWIDLWNRVYPYNYPQLLAKGVLMVVLAVLLAAAWRERRAVPALGRTFGAVVLCSATVYPWYLLWVLPWAALAGHGAWLALSSLVLLSYLPQFSDLHLVPWVYLAIWAPFTALLLWRRGWSTG